MWHTNIRIPHLFHIWGHIIFKIIITFWIILRIDPSWELATLQAKFILAFLKIMFFFIRERVLLGPARESVQICCMYASGAPIWTLIGRNTFYGPKILKCAWSLLGKRGRGRNTQLNCQISCKPQVSINRQIGQHMNFSELGLPGGQTLSGPRASIVHYIGAFQRQYKAKSKMSENFNLIIFLTYFLLIFLWPPVGLGAAARNLAR